MASEGDILDGKYLLRRMLGDGGMGNVFLAENVTLGHKTFAVKTLKPEYLNNHELVSRFLEEALAASKVEHDNIVEVFDAAIDSASGTPYIVQRYLRGTNLREHLDALPTRKLEPSEALELLVPIMGALVATHKQRIVHRDIKPENIFLVKTSSGNTVPKLIDFGIARHLEASPSDRRQTRSGAVWGTFDYMSPEQARGDQRCDERADIWSMGAVLFETITGRLPYEVAGHAELLERIAQGPPPSIDDVIPMCPTDVTEAVARALKIDPSQRWPSMAAFISALINCHCYQSTVPWRAVPLSSPDLSDVPDLSSLARPATEELLLLRGTGSSRVGPIPLQRSRRAESEPSSRTLQLVMPEPWTARRLLPLVAGVAAVLVGVLVGLRLQPDPITIAPSPLIAPARALVVSAPPLRPAPAVERAPEPAPLTVTVAEPAAVPDLILASEPSDAPVARAPRIAPRPRPIARPRASVRPPRSSMAIQTEF